MGVSICLKIRHLRLKGKKETLKMAPKYAMAIGRVRDKGFRVTKHKAPVKPSRRKGVQHKHVKFVREMVREIAGFAPYEKRCLELLKVSKVRQEASRSSHPRQEKARGDAERPPSAEKGRQRQAVICGNCHLHHLTFDFQNRHLDDSVYLCAGLFLFVQGLGSSIAYSNVRYLKMIH